VFKRLGIMVAAATVLGAIGASAAQAAPSAYVTNWGDREVAQYDVGAGGLLSPLSPFTVDAVGRWPNNVAISPDRKSVYVGNSGQLCDCPGDEPGSIAQYDVAADGTLSPKTPAKVQSCGSLASQVAVSPNGRNLYVAGGDDCSSVLQYDIAADGTLSPKSPAMVDVNDGKSQPVGVAVSPDSRSVYVTDYSYDDGVYQFDVDAAGRLVPKSPASVAAGIGSFGVAVAPDGQNVYVTNESNATASNGTVSQYDVGAGGKLIPKSTPLVAAGRRPRDLAVSPDNRSVYVANLNQYPGNGSVSQYDVDAGNGALSPKTPSKVSAGSGAADGIAVSPDSQSVYVANYGVYPANGNVSQYDVDAGGTLSTKSPARVPAGDGASGIAVRPLVGGPTTREQCKDGGWREFAFKNRRQCMRFVKNRARKSCRIERDEIGPPAFREKYGNPKHDHRRAFRRCVRQTVAL
jgi:6-phosphogluconolactonase (cycloisomerase 2 family)